MSDEIIGVAILDRKLTPQRLLCLCRPAGKAPLFQDLPVYAAGTPKPKTHNDAAWCYDVRGDSLHFTPSVHIQTHQREDLASRTSDWKWVTDFHNGYSWTVKFKDAVGESDDPSWPEKHLWAQLREANAELLQPKAG